MFNLKALPVVILTLLLGAVVLPMTAKGSGSQPRLAGIDLSGVRQTLENHEARLAALETSRSPSVVAPEPGPKSAEPDERVTVRVLRKRHSEAQFQEFLTWDVTYESRLKKPTRAIKGTLQVCDLFGEAKFLVGVTIDEPLQPSVPHTSEGIGIEYNQFRDDHKWFRFVDLEDTTVKFRVDSVIYQDGTREDF